LNNKKNKIKFVNVIAEVVFHVKEVSEINDDVIKNIIELYGRIDKNE